MNYKINFEQFKSNFALPAAIITEIRDTKPEYVKVILVIFAHPDKSYSSSLLSSLTGLSEAVVDEAMRWWAGKGLLKFEGSQQASARPNVEVVPQKPSVPKPVDDMELKFLIEHMGMILERTVTSTDIKTITYIFEKYRLPADVILMAVQYAVKMGKKDIRYIEKVCVGWYDRGIVNHTAAEEFLKRASELSKFQYEIKKMFGIENRKLIPSEEKFTEKWYSEFGFDLKVIALAFERTVKNTGKVAFAYTNKILLNWHEKGFRTVEEVEEKESGKPVSVKGSSSFDIDFLDEFWNQVPKLD